MLLSAQCDFPAPKMLINKNLVIVVTKCNNRNFLASKERITGGIHN